MLKRITIILLSLILIAVGYLLLPVDFEKAAPTLYYNANIITIDEDLPKAEAMLVVDGVIKDMGRLEDIDARGIEGLISRDLQGATLMPGFIDVHTHFALSMFLSNMYDLSGFKHSSNAAVWKYLNEVVGQARPGEWIVCKGLDPILVPDLVVPDLGVLDQIAPEHPLVIFSQSLHSYWANSRAFEEVGITADTPDPSDLSYYEKDKDGQLTGLIVEQEAFKVFADILTEKVLTPKVLSLASAKVMDQYAQNGNTTIVSTGLTINDSKPLLLLKHLSAQHSSMLGGALQKLGQLPARKPTPRHFIYMRHDRSELLPAERGEEDDFYDIIGVKHWYDGSPYIGSMYMDSSYLNSKMTSEVLHISRNSRGSALVNKGTLTAFIKQYHEAGWQIAIHTQGDAAIREVMDVYDELSHNLDFTKSRHRLEHCLLLPTDELSRVKRLNLFPSYHINHIYYYGDALANNLLGEQRSQQILPLKSSMDAGIISTLHADQPMFESKPFRLIQTAMQRQTKGGKVLGAGEAIDLLNALKSLTINAAIQIHKEDKIGSLKQGKYADFIILDRDPFAVSLGELEQIRCRETYVNGNKVNF
ncbi:MAG: amidohydrolase [Saprospiraceae bacterium]|nr:amidohydrolase [Saprospiraceae bacterium]